MNITRQEREWLDSVVGMYGIQPHFAETQLYSAFLLLYRKYNESQMANMVVPCEHQWSVGPHCEPAQCQKCGAKA